MKKLYLKRIEVLKKRFNEIYRKESGVIFQSPGRVNLIGEHTDYNGGYVLPIAIDRNILVAGRPNGEEDLLRLYSLNFDNTVICDFNRIKHNPKDGWANYPKGVAKILQNKGYKLKGMDLLFEGNIPIGSGLSSSAAIEVASCLALTTLSDIEIDKKEIPIICQKAENEFIGMKCGIMDQFVITFAKQGTALFLDCRNLKYKHTPISDSSMAIVITDTRKKRELVDSEYNTRRKQCEEGVKILKRYLKNISQLRDITSNQFEKYKNNLSAIIRKRCEHVIYEDERVKKSVVYLKENNLKKLGNLFFESHNSLRTLYEVSCHELDTIVETSKKIDGVLGSRMTGAGFGGCTVTLVKKDSVDEFIKKVNSKYEKKFQIKPEFYFCQAEDGVKEIKN